MNFIDEVKIFVKAGDGGDGCSALRREKNIRFGGPWGGDGGKGGDVIINAVEHSNTLANLRYRKYIHADKGSNGLKNNKSGLAGRDRVIDVPVGTQVLHEDRQLIIDLVKLEDKIVIARGGKGGLGNTHFKSSINRTPEFATKGTTGEEKWLILQLKTIADIGLVGLPNAGKSTFLSRCSNAKPKIANYAFTTLIPQLGLVNINNNEMVFADLPGLIRGAHEGIGLGIRFLQHIERCKIIVHLVDAAQEDVLYNYNVIRKELQAYGHALMQKQELVVLSRCDMIGKSELLAKRNILSTATSKKVYSIAVNHEVNDILQVIYTAFQAAKVVCS